MLHDLRNVLVEVILTVARNEFPLTIPPRWLGELFSMVSRVVALKMKANNWSLDVSLGYGCLLPRLYFCDTDERR